MKITILAFLAMCAITAIAFLIGGFMILKFWEWFIIPVFTFAPVINIGQAIGLSLFLSLFKSSVSIKRQYRDDESYTQLAQAIFVFVLGWIIHLIIS